jgi:hypothetical protein
MPDSSIDGTAFNVDGSIKESEGEILLFREKETEAREQEDHVKGGPHLYSQMAWKETECQHRLTTHWVSGGYTFIG